MNTFLLKKLYESMRLDESKSLDTNLVENLEEKIKSEFLNCLQDITRRFKKWATDDLFTTPIKIVNIYELSPNDEDAKDYRAYPPMPFVGIDCEIGINLNFDTSSGVEGLAYSPLPFGNWLRKFFEKIYGDCTSGLRDYSRVVKKTTVLNNGFRYEVFCIETPNLKYDGTDREFKYSGGSTYTFTIKMRPVKMRRK